LGREYLRHYLRPRWGTLIGIILLRAMLFRRAAILGGLHHEYWLAKVAA
jgi:hypothetical protein